jgi:TetR/AcrR family transcriptional repressor of nem operon
VAAHDSPDTAAKILDIAERLVQVHGFNGFSYADISAELKITKASLHYHFPSKAELGRSLIERYQANFLKALDGITREGRDALAALRSYVELYVNVLKQGRMCLCGMLAADYATLPKPMKEGVKGFFTANEQWLGRVLEDGRRAKALRFDGAGLAVAQTFVASLEGAMMVARSFGEISRFETAADRMLQELQPRRS